MPEVHRIHVAALASQISNGSYRNVANEQRSISAGDVVMLYEDDEMTPDVVVLIMVRRSSFVPIGFVDAYQKLNIDPWVAEHGSASEDWRESIKLAESLLMPPA